MIPEAAVEAAAKASHEIHEGDITSWAHGDQATRDRHLEAARCILEAAAPHMTCTHETEGGEMSAWEDDLIKALNRQLGGPVVRATPFVGLTDEEAAAQDRDRFPQAMIEGSTEYDWAELPGWLKDVMRHAADEFRRWSDAEPIRGEVIPAQFEVEP